MKKILALIFIIWSSCSFCQCVSINKLLEISQKDLEFRNQVLSEIGFYHKKSKKIEVNLVGPEYYNKALDNFINIKFHNEKKFEILYRLKGNKKCYEQLINSLDQYSADFDSEKTSIFGTRNVYYSNEKNGFIFSSWEPIVVDGTFFSVRIVNLEEYHNRINQ